uniref:Cell cycle control protein n=1 Tax=Fundulus heteroclitus TaxID=8078 RepID=A0A3Q2P554_FUNHE
MMASSYNAKEEDGHPSGSSTHGGPGVAKNKKPDNTAFKQQRLPAWQPILTAGTVLPAFFVIGLIFIPIGIGLYVTSNNIKEKEIDYTGVEPDSPCYECATNFSWNITTPCVCTVNFTLEQPFEVSSFYRYLGFSAFFSVKTRTRVRVSDSSTTTLLLTMFYLACSLSGTAKPVNWRKPVYELDPSDPENNGFINEDFIVWMRTAALPTFRKLYRIIHKKPDTSSTLPSGRYTLKITYNYPVRSFDGRKRMILSTISWMGGKNPFLGIAYMTVGSICFFLGVVLLVIHHKYDTRSNSADIPN